MIKPHWKLLYSNPLNSKEHIADFVMEGQGVASFPQNRLRLESRAPGEGPDASAADAARQVNFVCWCPESFPDHIAVTWEFKPLREPGLAIMFFAAEGRAGVDLFDEGLSKRNGDYVQYHHGDMNALHLSYFRRRWSDERQFHTCNLRKSYGFHLVAQGADPIPSVEDCGEESYRMLLIKRGASISFSINELQVLEWMDDGKSFGPLLRGGKIGFRQMSPLIAEYANMNVYAIAD